MDPHDGTPTYVAAIPSPSWSLKFVVKVPKNLSPPPPRPCCALASRPGHRCGHWKVGPGSKVAVGLGGLGHMAIKLAKALGADVTLFSRSPGKEEDAQRLGARHVVLSTFCRANAGR